MTDLEISKALALAIGWKRTLTSSKADICYVQIVKNEWRAFDYRDPAVIWPIAKKFDLFPCQVFDDKWVVDWNISDSSFDTPEKAVAMAVIDSMEM